MNTLMAIFSYPGGSDALARHWEYFKRQGAETWGIGTTDGQCKWPDELKYTLDIGANSYIDGPHLPQRMVDTVKELLELPAWDALILCEYDTLFLNPIKMENLAELLASHWTGGPTWGSKVDRYYHNPWVMKRIAAHNFIHEGQKAIDDGVCGKRNSVEFARPEGSPDVFFAYIADQMGVTVQEDLWSEYTQNDLKDHDRLEGARKAFKEGVDIIHGVKTKEELDYITQ